MTAQVEQYIPGVEGVHFPSGTTLVAIGNFDGVHAGHRAVLGRACAEARDKGLEPLVLTFHPHPSEVLGRGALPRLTALDRKVELIRRIDPALRVVVQRFDKALASLQPEEFVEQLLVGHLGAGLVLVGHNFRFGQRRSGDMATLERLGARYGFEARAESLQGDERGAFSSTRIREAIAEGQLAEAQRLLGRPHMLSGPVVVGDRRGRQLGFPTANLSPVAEATPPDGVYAVLVDLEEDGRSHALDQGVMNIGLRPTFEAGRSYEVHLLNQQPDLYGRRLRVHLMKRLRGEQRFDGVEALREQITRDVEQAREALRDFTPDPVGKPWY